MHAAPRNGSALNTTAWHIAQWLGLLATVVLIVALARWPEPSLNLLWNAIIPVLPAVFLINPLLWRNVCPLATLNTLTGDHFGTRAIDGEAVRRTLVVGATLLVVLVSGRRLVFNTNGPALSGVVVLVGGLALAGGALFERKAGFCNSICPVQPVERLYGQRPLLRVVNARCPTCIGCTERGCPDRSLADAMRTVIGPRAASPTWIHSPFGYFAAGFPGFIVGYFTVDNAPLSNAPALLLHVAIAIAVSAVVVVLLVRGFRLGSTTALPVLGALAVSLYYWFAGPAIATAWSAPAALGWLIRGAAFALIGWWLVRALAARGNGHGLRTAPRVER